MDDFSVNVWGQTSFLSRLAGIRIRINNEMVDGRLHDLEASHPGDREWRIDGIFGSSEPLPVTARTVLLGVALTQ